MRTFPVYFLIALLSSFGQGWAAGEQAISRRNANALAEYSPPESFLNGNFIADEVEPTFIFGKVKDFAKSRSCPTSWLIEQGERQRLQTRDPQSSQFEYTLYFEEDCPGKITYYVFAKMPEALRGDLATTDFTEAERNCPHDLEIPRLMREALTLLA